MRLCPLVILMVAAGPLAAQDLYDLELLPFAGRITDIKVLDVDLDGHPDLLASATDVPGPDVFPLQQLVVARGDGRGGFGLPLVTTLPSDPLFAAQSPLLMAAGDLDEDGLPDALVVNPVGGQGNADIQTLLGDGSGAFVAHQLILDPGLLFAADTELADFDGDGHADALVADHSTYRVFRGDGAGDLDPMFTGTESDQTFGPDTDVGDVDADGLLDLVGNTASFEEGVRWLRGDGTGGFAAPVLLVTGVSKSQQIVLDDFDVDGALDVASCASYAFGASDGEPLPFLSVLRGHGDGSFDAALAFVVPPYVKDMLSADIDGSGRPDLVSTHGGQAWITHDPLGGPADTYSGPGGGSTVSGGPVDELGIADIDTDGWPDLVCAGASAQDESWAVRFFNDGAGGLESPPSRALPDAGSLSLLADTDADGALDEIIVLVSGGLVRLAGDGAGGFGPPEPLPLVAATGLALADLDQDGVLDIATANHATHDLSVLLAYGDGFTDSQAGGWPWFTWNQSPDIVRAADLDGDGASDLVVSKSQKASLSLVRSDGAGGFLAPDDFGPVDHFDPDLELGDMDEDGALDLVASLVHLNDGDGHFAPGAAVLDPLVSSSMFGGLELADMNGDGHLDAVFAADVYDPADPDKRGLITRAGDGAGGFGPSKVADDQDFAVAGLADVDGDGLRDALSSVAAPGIRAAFGDGNGGFAALRAWGLPTGGSVGLGDIDGDARPDFVLVGSAEPALFTLLHRDTHFTWSDLGHALGAAPSAPRLDGHGPLVPGSMLHVQVDALPHDALLTLLFGGSQLGAPFKGGVLVPSPDRLLAGLPAGPAGFLALQGEWPTGMQVGVELFVQAWVPDTAGPQGWLASNALGLAAP